MSGKGTGEFGRLYCIRLAPDQDTSEITQIAAAQMLEGLAKRIREGQEGGRMVRVTLSVEATVTRMAEEADLGDLVHQFDFPYGLHRDALYMTGIETGSARFMRVRPGYWERVE